MSSVNKVNELWRAVINYEGYYEVSSLGNLKSLDRVIKTSNGRIVQLTGCHIIPTVDKHGYYNWSPCKNNKRKKTRVHMTVAEAFLGDNPLMLDINHIDGCKSNNSASNLEYCTRSNNIRHSFKLGLSKNRPPVKKGEHHPMSKLNWDQVNEIRKIGRSQPVETTAMQFNVSKTTIKDILKFKIWKNE